MRVALRPRSARAFALHLSPIGCTDGRATAAVAQSTCLRWPAPLDAPTDVDSDDSSSPLPAHTQPILRPPTSVPIAMSSIHLGTHEFGACTVTFDKASVRFKPTVKPDDVIICVGCPEISLTYMALTRLEIVKAKGTLCLWGNFDLEVPGEVFAPWEAADAVKAVRWFPADVVGCPLLKVSPKLKTTCTWSLRHAPGAGHPARARPAAAAQGRRPVGSMRSLRQVALLEDRSDPGGVLPNRWLRAQSEPERNQCSHQRKPEDEDEEVSMERRRQRRGAGSGGAAAVGG